jgi:hypothetical protein
LFKANVAADKSARKPPSTPAFLPIVVVVAVLNASARYQRGALRDLGPFGDLGRGPSLVAHPAPPARRMALFHPGLPGAYIIGGGKRSGAAVPSAHGGKLLASRSIRIMRTRGVDP